MSENLKWQLATGASTPEEVNEALLNLRSDLDSERKRREEAEQGRREAEAREHDAHSDRQKAEALQRKAERERDWARGEVEGVRRVLKDERADRDLAAADNAALLECLQRVGNEDTCCWCGESKKHLELCPVGLVIAHPHPGAALLERMRALEEWVSKAKERIESLAHADECSVEDPYDPEETDGCVCPLALLSDIPETT